ncbi:hypothetical protein IG631_03667 [Alternaria alternata]|nr:hypothetical protein IG631_03667 [Alternaria alternata]
MYVCAEGFASDHGPVSQWAGIDPELLTSVAKKDSAARWSQRRTTPGHCRGMLRLSTARDFYRWENRRARRIAARSSGLRLCTGKRCMHSGCNRACVAVWCPRLEVCCGIAAELSPF